jgi:hypothetical protein
MLDIDRRSLLKGILASTAVLAAPAALMAEPGPIEMLPDVTPVIEPGEMFIRSRGLWRFAGRAMDLQMRREIEEVHSIYLQHPEFVGLPNWDVTVRFTRLAGDSGDFMLGRVHELDAIAIGQREGTIIIEGRPMTTSFVGQTNGVDGRIVSTDHIGLSMVSDRHMFIAAR